MAKKILRLPEVLNRVGVKRATLYEWISAGKFPAQIKLGVRSVGWSEEAIDNWILSRINASNG